MRRIFSELKALAPFGLVVVAGGAMASLAEEAPTANAPAAVVSPAPGASASPGPADGHAGAGHGKAKAEASACLADASSVEDLKKAREELEARQKAISAREAELGVKERALKEELKRLEVVRDEISKGTAEKKKEAEERIAKLVETLEGMSPKSAAQLLAGIDEALAVTAMSRISTTQLSKVLSSMESTRSARLTERLGGLKPRPNDSSLERMNQSAKGGERNDGQYENRNAVASRSNGADGSKSPSSQGTDASRQPAGATGPTADGNKSR